VVPLDLSEPAGAALEVAVRWAGAFGAASADLSHPETDVAVVHVLPAPFTAADAVLEAAVVPPGLNRGIEKAVRAAGSPPGVRVREEVRWNGQPGTEIVSFAWRDRADLLVLATHGRGAMKRALIGSTAFSVVRRAPCPVLLVPPAMWRRRRGGRTVAARASAAVAV